MMSLFETISCCCASHDKIPNKYNIGTTEDTKKRNNMNNTCIRKEDITFNYEHVSTQYFTLLYTTLYNVFPLSCIQYLTYMYKGVNNYHKEQRLITL